MIVDRKVSIEISKPAAAIFVKKMLVTHTQIWQRQCVVHVSQVFGLAWCHRALKSIGKILHLCSKEGKETHENRTARG